MFLAIAGATDYAGIDPDCFPGLPPELRRYHAYAAMFDVSTAEGLVDPSCFLGLPSWEQDLAIFSAAQSIVTDPLSSITSLLRIQTHDGDNVPVGLYQDVAMTIPATDAGHVVAAWRDEIGESGVVFTQATAANRPILQFEGGIPVLDFDGVNDSLTSIAAIIGSVRYAVAVVRQPVNYASLQQVGVLNAVSQLRLLTWFPNTSTVYATDNNDFMNGLDFTRVNAASTTVFPSGYSTFLQRKQAPRSISDTISIGTAFGAAAPMRSRLIALFLFPTTITVDDVNTIEDYCAGLCDTPLTGPPYSELYTATQGTVSGSSYTILRPASVPPNDTLILHCHGAGEIDTSIYSEQVKYAAMTVPVLNAGYTIMGVSGPGLQWGTQAEIDSYDAAVAQAVSLFPSLTKVVIWSHSMGGVSGLLLVSQGLITNLKGWFGTDAVCNLANMYATGFHGAIQGAYGIAGDDSDYAAKTAGHDPVLLPAAGFATRMRFTASATDATVAKVENTDQMKTLVNAVATESGVVTVSGNHGASNHFDSVDFLSFLSRCV